MPNVNLLTSSALTSLLATECLPSQSEHYTLILYIENCDFTEKVYTKLPLLRDSHFRPYKMKFHTPIHSGSSWFQIHQCNVPRFLLWGAPQVAVVAYCYCCI